PRSVRSAAGCTGQRDSGFSVGGAVISYWVTEKGSFGIRGYRENLGQPVADRFTAHLYEQIGPVVRFAGGPQIFSALDQLTGSQRRVVAAIWDAHARAAANAPRLNDPRRVLLRFPLLRSLYDRGLNSYRVYRSIDVKDISRFPVFVRHIHD